MKRSDFFRRLLAVATCVWTMLLLTIRFTPMHTQSNELSDHDAARSYTVPATQILTSETQTESLIIKTDSIWQEQSLPLQEYKHTALPQTQKAETTTVPENIPQDTTQSSSAEDASESEPKNQSAQNNILSPLQQQTTVTLPVLSDTAIADVGETTMRPLRFGAQVTTALPGEGKGVVYILTVTERGSIRYTLEYPSLGAFSEVGWKLTLYEEYDRLGNSGSLAYRMLNILTSNVATDNVTTAEIGVQPGTYRLVLEQNGDFSREDVSVLAEFTAATDREIEPNDTPGRYTELYAGHAIKGASGKYETSTDTDEDWFLFRMPYDGYANYTFTHEAMDMVSVGWQIFLYDAGLNQLSFNNAAIAENSVTGEKVGLAEGIYFVCVKGRVHSTQDYAVKVDITQAALYEHESNDTFDTATPLTPGQTVTGMMNNRSQGIDYDMYAVDLTKAGSLKVTFRHAALDEDQDGWNVSLLNADGEVLYTTTSNWMDTVNISPEMGLAAGTYYVCIDSDNRYFTAEPYTLTVEHTSDAGFESEPNNTLLKADEIKIGKPVKGSLTQTGLETDCDYFVVNVAADADIVLTFSHTTVNLDRIGWNITLTDADGNVFTPMDEKGLPLTDTNGAMLNYLAVNWNKETASAHYRLKAGDYFVRVDTGNYFSSETYTLLLNKK